MVSGTSATYEEIRMNETTTTVYAELTNRIPAIQTYNDQTVCELSLLDN
jgi:hypothetical protein